MRFPPRFSADDGIVSTSNQGLYVKAAGTNPLTGEPAFTKTSPGEDDHVKWMADTHFQVGRVSGHASPLADPRTAARTRGGLRGGTDVRDHTWPAG